MKNFLNDSDGVDQRDYLVIFSTLLYALILIPVVGAVIFFPDKYPATTLNYFDQVLKITSTAYGIVLTFFFTMRDGPKLIDSFKGIKNIPGASTISNIASGIMGSGTENSSTTNNGEGAG